jgi:hypothetical protein
MIYTVFPFGKFKGVLLEELESTYIVHALEKFDLPLELAHDLRQILAERFLLLNEPIQSVYLHKTFKKVAKLYYSEDKAIEALNKFMFELLT